MSNRWAILIGIDQYHESLGSLKYSGADCQAIEDALVRGPLAFPEDQILRLDDTQDAEHRPTFANIHSCLGSWLAAPKEDDLVFVYFAGHGRLEDGNTYLVPSDATLATIHTLGIAMRHVQDLIERCKAKQKLLVLDACHSGAGRDVTTMTSGMQDALAQGTGFYTISSCGAEELSHEWKDKGHGVFSFFLAEALRGGCSPAADGRLTMDRLYEWVHDHIVKWAAQHRCSQTPQRFAKGGGSLVLAESAPDHAALAQQYRRELEETQARLAEIELRQARDRVAAEEARRLQEAKARQLEAAQREASIRRAKKEAYNKAPGAVKSVHVSILAATLAPLRLARTLIVSPAVWALLGIVVLAGALVVAMALSANPHLVPARRQHDAKVWENLRSQVGELSMDLYVVFEPKLDESTRNGFKSKIATLGASYHVIASKNDAEKLSDVQAEDAALLIIQRDHSEGGGGSIAGAVMGKCAFLIELQVAGKTVWADGLHKI